MASLSSRMLVSSETSEVQDGKIVHSTFISELYGHSFSGLFALFPPITSTTALKKIPTLISPRRVQERVDRIFTSKVCKHPSTRLPLYPHLTTVLSVGPRSILANTNTTADWQQQQVFLFKRVGCHRKGRRTCADRRPSAGRRLASRGRSVLCPGQCLHGVSRRTENSTDLLVRGSGCMADMYQRKQGREAFRMYGCTPRAGSPLLSG